MAVYEFYWNDETGKEHFIGYYQREGRIQRE